MHGFFVTPPEVVTPPPATTVWRYMPFWKFQDLVLTQTLYFTRVDRFPDDLEGIPPRKVTQAIERIAKVAKEIGAGSNAGHILRDRTRYKRFFYANCWHMREAESHEMWETYLKVSPPSRFHPPSGGSSLEGVSVSGAPSNPSVERAADAASQLKDR